MLVSDVVEQYLLDRKIKDPFVTKCAIKAVYALLDSIVRTSEEEYDDLAALDKSMGNYGE